ncbi:MAG TPA: calcium/sodium antiporter [Cyclobacteriaceae bacterium]|nr:calcium/sodium antiporter [Cyclobacteriaceae bacterium]HRK52340.1 calcium/sodium antiporter [Cyclobacteriaceae bacterium]
MVIQIILLLAGFVILVKGADFLVGGSSSIAKKFNISNLAIGLTVVALGTSTPELIVSVISAINGKSDAAFGNIIGSNNFNLLFILGVSGLIYPLVVQRNTIKYEVPISLIAASVMLLLVNDQFFTKGASMELSRGESMILLIGFGLFLLYVYRSMSGATDLDEGGKIKIYSTWISIGLVIAGLAMLVGGGKLVVDNAIAIAHHAGLSERIIGLTILAAGTSLPELATSAVAAYRKNTDIAIGNVVGSNIFNVLFILGTTGLIHPVSYNKALNFDVYILMASTVLLMVFMFTLGRRQLDRWEAFILLAGYVTYTIFLIGTENT